MGTYLLIKIRSDAAQSTITHSAVLRLRRFSLTPVAFHDIMVLRGFKLGSISTLEVKTMQNAKGKQNRESHVRYGKQILAILICVALFGVIAWAQKTNGENKKGITLRDLGVTEAQKVRLEELWNLKRQKDIQAINDLKTLNRLAKDSLVGDTEIQKTLDGFRAKRKEMQRRIEEIEEELVQTLPTRAQLHLTLMGVLDNGIPRRTKKTQPDKTTDAASKPPPKQQGQ